MTDSIWQLQEAKQRFSTVVERALAGDAQVVTRRGEEVVVVISIDDYRHLRSHQPDLKAYLRVAPDLEPLEIVRSPQPAPRVGL